MNLSLSNMLSSTASGLDPDAKAYIAAVETADGQALESGVRKAINNFVVGCKGDGIWDAIKASCILAGARTLSGALTPLVGTAPTNNNFVSGDYNRETGLIGDGSTKYLDSNRNNNADPQDNFHAAVYRSYAVDETKFIIGAGASPSTGRLSVASVTPGGGCSFRLRTNTGTPTFGTAEIGLVAGSRANSSTINYVVGSASGSVSSVSETPLNANIGIFSNNVGASPSSARLSFYSIGESLDLALLDTRVSTLMEQIFKGIYGIDFDDDAYAYITEIRSSGASVDSTQINAINTFVKSGKSDGWYSSIKRLYLPIWASAAPNAIDMITRSSGTFNGTVTHSAGYVQGDGTTGYFNSGGDLVAFGLTPASGYMFVLAISNQTSASGSFMGSGAAANSLLLREQSGDQVQYMYSGFTGIGTATVSVQPTGILSFSRNDGDRLLARRISSGRSELSRITGADSGDIVGSPFLFLGRSNSNTSAIVLTAPTDAQCGAYGVGLGLEGADDSAFTLALKDLWETCTGLTLP